MKSFRYAFLGLALVPAFLSGCGSGGSPVVTTTAADASAEEAAKAEMQKVEDAERARDTENKKKK